MLGDAPKSDITGVPGWITQAEENLLISLAAQVPDNGNVVNLGGEFGRSAAAMGHILKELGRKETIVIVVDLFPNDYQNVGSLLAAFNANIAEAGMLSQYVMGVQSTTVDLAQQWALQSVDLLFVDAGHHYSEVKADIEAWVGKIKPNGLLVFHDYAKNESAHYLHYEVKHAVDEWHAANPDWQRYEGVDSIVYFTAPADYVGHGVLTDDNGKPLTGGAVVTQVTDQQIEQAEKLLDLVRGGPKNLQSLFDESKREGLIYEEFKERLTDAQEARLANWVHEVDETFDPATDDFSGVVSLAYELNMGLLKLIEQDSDDTPAAVG